MTVMVTGASGLLGHAIVRALVEDDEVRATVRRPEAGEPLRALGAKVAVLPFEEPEELVEILPRVHTIVHLVGGVNQPTDEEILAANQGSTLAVFADDVGAAVAAIDDRRDRVEGVWSITGTDELSADEVFATIGEDVEPQHLEPGGAAERLSRLLEIPISLRATELFAASSVADTATDAAAAFGVTVTPFDEGLRLTAERASEAADRVRR